MTTDRQTFRQFFLRSWIWSLIIDLILLSLALWFFFTFVKLHGTHTLFIINLIAMLAAGVHAFLLLIFAIRRWSRKEGWYGMIFFVHALLTGCLAYTLCYTWLWGLLSATKS
jgi:hypothetical protein